MTISWYGHLYDVRILETTPLPDRTIGLAEHGDTWLWLVQRSDDEHPWVCRSRSKLYGDRPELKAWLEQERSLAE